ncbi:helix-turn-helix transcriptional regulator [Streptomyces sp. NPDC003717]|uniref:helix-turn-helix transcriptional regulator n=1 Tax=Streptomyces sp. NPDC003717 TaxID=3154276 RepID=UPI0033B1858C
MTGETDGRPPVPPPSPPHAAHGPEELCAAGTDLYLRALADGRLPVREAAAAPCLADCGLLRPALDDLEQLEPVAPALALQRLLGTFEGRIAEERQRAQRLAETFEPLLQRAFVQAGPAPAGTPPITLHSDKWHIGQVLDEALTDAHEVLTIQPHRSYAPNTTAFAESAMRRDQAFLDRGGRMRALYQHTLRHAPTVVARYEQLRGDVEARSLDEVTNRLIVIDREVAFIPANEDRSMALEIRQPALVGYLVTVFDRFWRLGLPMHPRAVQQPTVDGITARQRAIAALLIDGHTDADIAERLGMNIRTARVHIAKLATTLGSDSRAQLGYLIGRSGILEQEQPEGPA